MVIAPILAAVIVATVFLMRRAGVASRFLVSTIGRTSLDDEGGDRVPCGLSVRKPGRLAYGYPSCTLEIRPNVLVVFGPLGARVAEFAQSSNAVMKMQRRLLWELWVTEPGVVVIIAVREEAAETLKIWLCGSETGRAD